MEKCVGYKGAHGPVQSSCLAERTKVMHAGNRQVAHGVGVASGGEEDHNEHGGVAKETHNAGFGRAILVIGIGLNA